MERRLIVWIRRALAFAAVAVTTGVIALVTCAWWWDLSDLAERRTLERPDDANWRYVKSLGRTAWDESDPGTFAGLNGGHWTQLCVVGGYKNPSVEFGRAFGRAGIADEMRRWLERRTHVEEYDLAVIWRDEMGRDDVLYYVSGGTVETQGIWRCLDRNGVVSSTPEDP